MKALSPATEPTGASDQSTRIDSRSQRRKRGGTWYAYYDLPPKELPPDPKTGKPRWERQQKAKGGFARQKDAEAFLDEVLPKVREGSYVEPSTVPLARFMLSEWLPSVRGQIRPLTVSRYESIVRTYVAGRDIGAVPLRALSPGHLNALYVELQQAGLSAATCRLVAAVLGRALRDAERSGHVPRNVSRMADPPALPRSRAQSWTASELRRFLAHVATDRLFAAWRLAATTGMRRGEMLGLTWRALDLDDARLRVDQQLVPTRGGCTFGPPKSRRSERTIALDAGTVEALHRHRDVQLLERDVAGPAYEDGDLVFCDPLGGPIHPQRLTEWFSKHRKAAGIPTGSLHVLRHTAATLALTATPPVPLHVLAGRLGDDPKQILGTYAHLLATSDAMAAEVVAAQLVDNR